MQKKRGGGHVGFVLSFVIFVTFLIFLYSIIIEPTKIDKSKQFLLEKIKLNLIENISSELLISSINTEDTQETCIRLNNLTTDLGVNARIIVKNESGNIQTSYVLTNDLEISRSNYSNVFFKIYYSEKFGELNDTGEEPCNQGTYKKGLVRVNKYVFESNVIDLINRYKNNYEEVKRELEIPAESEFIFSFTYNNKTKIGVEKNATANIYAEEIPVQYVDKNATILLGNLNIRTW